MRTLLALDATNLAHRAYHGMAASDLRSPSGEPMWVAHGVLRFLSRFIKEFSPSSVLLAADDGGGCPYRRGLAPHYKASRSSPPPDLVSQLISMQDLFVSAGLPFVTVPGWEADDILASAAQQAKNLGARVFVVSSDKDLHQIVDAPVTVVKPEGVLMSAHSIFEKWGVHPSTWVDFAALCGEPSDNLPGVPGVGPKKAAKLISRCGGVDGIFSSREVVQDVLGPRLTTAVFDSEDAVRTNFAVGSLRRDLSFDVSNLSTVRLLGSCDVLKAVLPDASRSLASAVAGVVGGGSGG